jgi:hypothetical protein
VLIDAYNAILMPHGEILDEASSELDKSKVRPDVKKLMGYKMELNFRLSAWDRLETETNLFVLTGLLLYWLEHLKSPILDQVREERLSHKTNCGKEKAL